jgi:crotonobetainyl-CoA:carnitine CoA-transferase CaiB-like acyl-CoA transferase
MTQAVLAALFHRERTGQGQFVEVPMFECVTGFNLAEHLFGHVYDPPTGPWAYSRVANPNRKPFKTKDGYIGLLPYTDGQWSAFFALAGWSDSLSSDPRFKTAKARAENAEALYGLLEEVTQTKTTDEWLQALKALQIPVTRTNRLPDLLEDPHLDAVGFFERYRHPEAGSYLACKPPLKFSRTPANVRRHPPRLGEHTQRIAEEIAKEP